MKKWLALFVSYLMVLVMSANASENQDLLPDIPEGAQAVSLLGDPLYPSPPSEKLKSNLEQATKKFESDPNDADNIVWYGRRTAYTGDYREAIRIYTKGIEQFPDDARFYRHRGHRYISIREFDRAILDFEQAATLIRGKKDRIEPDGIPNARNIPLTSLHRNIWYHLGLAFYLENDLENALTIFRKGADASANDDSTVSTAHWLYMILRRLGREDDAKELLQPIHPDMDIIDNMAYHQLCLFYKGELPLESLTNPQFDNISNDAVAYGIGNWFLYNDDRDKAKSVYEKILKNKSWASFGYIAAEADFVREFGQTDR
jgi:tetratricopeptide (TPR) repeat protein